MPPNRSPKASPFYGLFDVSKRNGPMLGKVLTPLRQFADVNAFLTLAATRHKIRADELREKPRVQEILDAARDGKVPAYLVSSAWLSFLRYSRPDMVDALHRRLIGEEPS